MNSKAELPLAPEDAKILQAIVSQLKAVQQQSNLLTWTVENSALSPVGRHLVKPLIRIVTREGETLSLPEAIDHVIAELEFRAKRIPLSDPGPQEEPDPHEEGGIGV